MSGCSGASSDAGSRSTSSSCRLFLETVTDVNSIAEFDGVDRTISTPVKVLYDLEHSGTRPLRQISLWRAKKARSSPLSVEHTDLVYVLKLRQSRNFGLASDDSQVVVCRAVGLSLLELPFRHAIEG